MAIPFRDLSPTEAEEFRAYARANDPDPKTWNICHPVCREEWIKLGKTPVTLAAIKDAPAIDGAVILSIRERDVLVRFIEAAKRVIESDSDDAWRALLDAEKEIG